MAVVFVLPSFPGEHSWGRQSCPSQGLQRCRGCRDDAAQLSPPGTIWWIPAQSHGTGASLGRRCGAPASHSETLTLSQNRMGCFIVLPDRWNTTVFYRKEDALPLSKRSASGDFPFECVCAGLLKGVPWRPGDDGAEELCCGGDRGTNCRQAVTGEFSSKPSFRGDTTDFLLCFGGEPNRPGLKLQPLSSPLETNKHKQNDRQSKITSGNNLRWERCSPVRFLGLSGRRGCRVGGGAAECLGDKGVGWGGESGLIRARVWGSGLVGDWSGGGVRWGILEREETLQDLRRGKSSMGWAWLWERVLGI